MENPATHTSYRVDVVVTTEDPLTEAQVLALLRSSPRLLGTTLRVVDASFPPRVVEGEAQVETHGRQLL